MSAYKIRDMIHPLTTAIIDLCKSRGDKVEDGYAVICCFAYRLDPSHLRDIIKVGTALSSSIQEILERLDPSAHEEEKDICYQLGLILAQYIRDWVYWKPLSHTHDLRESMINGCYGAITRLQNGIKSAAGSYQDGVAVEAIRIEVCQRFERGEERVRVRPNTLSLQAAKGEIHFPNHVPKPPVFGPPSRSPSPEGEQTSVKGKKQTTLRFPAA